MSTRKQTSESINTSKNFQSFFAKAIEEFDSFADEREWAREATLAFRRKYKVSTKFVTVYFAFLNEAEKHKDEGANDTYDRDGFVVDDDEVESEEEHESEDEWDDEASYDSESIASQEYEEEDAEPKRTTQVVNSNVFTEDGEPTRAEIDRGNQMLNKIIMKEYNAWYDAFKEEAEEDGDEDAMNADERFQWHCAKVLSRKTDIRAKDIYPIVGAWVIQYHKA
jgi:hypothetical protein